MNRGFTVSFTIDTEPDNQWANHRNASTENVRWLRPMHELFARHGVRPSYLLTYSVATCPTAVAELGRLLKTWPAEIGAHLHPWDNEPFAPDGWDREHPVYPHELPLELFAEKMHRLVGAITDNFGPPRTYRAGRFGFVGAHARVLEDLGFLVDCSVTPLLDRRDKYGAPRERGGLPGRDYRRAPLRPYHMRYDDETRVGDSHLVEIPLTSGLTRRWPRAAARALAYAPRLFQKALSRTRLVQTVTASPVQFLTSDILQMLRAGLDQGLPTVNVTFHSSEMMPGGSPLFPSQFDVACLHAKIESIVRWLGAKPGASFQSAYEATQTLLSADQVLRQPIATTQRATNARPRS